VHAYVEIAAMTFFQKVDIMPIFGVQNSGLIKLLSKSFLGRLEQSKQYVSFNQGIVGVVRPDEEGE
jgi:hypothetical protein